MALLVARVCRPASKLATSRWWTDTTLAADFDREQVSTDEVYAAMDWLAGRQEAIEAKLAARHLTGDANPDRLALFDLSSFWMTGSHCPLAAREAVMVPVPKARTHWVNVSRAMPRSSAMPFNVAPGVDSYRSTACRRNSSV